MSHLSKIKTSMLELSCIKKSLDELNIKCLIVEDETFGGLIDKILIEQPKSNIEFVWNGKSYEMNTDLSYWKQSLPVNEFLDFVNEKYISYSLKENAKDLGFEPIRTEGNTLIMERWVR